MLNKIQNFIKHADKINLFYTTIGLTGSGFVGYHAYQYYKDATLADAKSRARAISQLEVEKKINSVRVNDVEAIKERLNCKPEEILSTYTVIVGPRGIGKTVAIKTAAEKLKGII